MSVVKRPFPARLKLKKPSNRYRRWRECLFCGYGEVGTWRTFSKHARTRILRDTTKPPSLKPNHYLYCWELAQINQQKGAA